MANGHSEEFKRDAVRIALTSGLKGYCWDNAVTETFFKTLKAELIWRQMWHTRRRAKVAVFQ